MKKDDFCFDKVGDGIYSIAHVPSGRHLGTIKKAWRGWDAFPSPVPYGAADMTMVEAAQALLDKLDSEDAGGLDDLQEGTVIA